MDKKMMAMKMMMKGKPDLDFSKLKERKMGMESEMEAKQGFVSMMVSPEEKKMIMEMRGDSEEGEEMGEDPMESMKQGMKLGY